MKRFLISVLTIVTMLSFTQKASAQRFSIGTNGVDWIALGAINAEASVAVAQHFSIHAGAEINPWSYMKSNPDKQFQIRHITYWAGVRWWPWYTYSGWWAGSDFRYDVYNEGGLFKRKTEEGDAYSMGFYGGYSIMLNTWLNLDFGLGVFSGYKKFTEYACPSCGVRTNQGGKFFVHPDVRVALLFVF